MKTKLVFMVASVLLVSAPLFAHHGRVGYDNKKVLTLKAKVTEFDWTNPHVQILFDAPDEKGVAQHWDVEGTNPFGASRAGWTKNSFKPGDQITITFHPAANGLGITDRHVASGDVLCARLPGVLSELKSRTNCSRGVAQCRPGTLFSWLRSLECH
jgi:Family of unknown function (DUF6152)